MSAKDDFRMQLCWGLACLTTLDAILMFFSINCFPNFHPHLQICLTLIPHDEEPNLCILSQIPNCFPNFHPYLLICSTLIPHDEEPNLCILSQIPNCLPNFHPYLLICSTLIPHDEEPNLCILSQIPLQRLNHK